MPYSIETNIILFSVLLFGIPLFTKCLFIITEYYIENITPSESIDYLIYSMKENTTKVSILRIASYAISSIGYLALVNGVVAIRTPMSALMGVIAVFASSIVSLNVKKYSDRLMDKERQNGGGNSN